MLMSNERFVQAEMDYRLAQARKMYGPPPAGRRHQVRGRPWLRLPGRRRRPLSLA